jgi:hypothetical protein
MTAKAIEGVSGQYFADGKEVEPSATAQDNELAERLCMATSQLLQGGSSTKSSDSGTSGSTETIAVVADLSE